MASAFENRLRRTIEMAGTDGQAGPVPVMATISGPVLENIGNTLSLPIRSIPFAKRPGYIGASITNGSSSSNAGTKSYSALLKNKLNAARKSVSSVYRGYTGMTSTYIAAQVATSLADNLSVLVVGPDFGTNSTGLGISLAQYKADVLAVTAAAQSVGVPIIFCKTLPKAASAGTANRDLVGQYNTWLTFFCLLNNIPLADTYTPMADPLTGYLRSAYDTDGTHPNDAGHAALADAIYPVVASVLPTLPEFVTYGGGGLVTAGNEVMLASWNDSGVGTAAFTARVVADPAAGYPLSIGRWNTASLGSAGYRIMSKSLGNLGTTFNVGDKLLTVAALSTTSSAGSSASLQLLRGGSTNVATCGSTNAESPIEIASTYTVQAADTSLFIGLSINCSAGETVVGRVGKCGVYNLTAMGLNDVF